MNWSSVKEKKLSICEAMKGAEGIANWRITTYGVVLLVVFLLVGFLPVGFLPVGFLPVGIITANFISRLDVYF